MATLSTAGKKALDDFIEEAGKGGKVPGVLLGISNLEEEIYFKGAGFRELGDPASGEITPDSIFWICSQTKLIAALATLKLIDMGKLAYETPVGDYLPEFRNPIIVDKTSTQKTAFRPAQTTVTVKHLLSFSSGLFYPVVQDNLTGLTEGYSSKEMHTAEDPLSAFYQIVIGELPALPLKFEPGTNWVYGWSSDALGFLVEKVSGQTLEQFCREHIFEPLGMGPSFYLTPELRSRAVSLSFRQEDGSLEKFTNQLSIIEQDPSKLRLHLGGVGLYSSMRDYLKLFRHLMQIKAGRSVPNAILKAQTVHDIFVPVLSPEGQKSLSEFAMTPGLNWGTALALCMQDRPGFRKEGSAFWGGWAGTSGFMDPTTGIAVVFGTQVAPARDLEIQTLWFKLEKLIYSVITTSTGSPRL